MAIWWERNKRIFQNQPSTVEFVLSALEVVVGEVVIAYVKRTFEHLIISGWDIALANRCASLPSPSYQLITSGGPCEKLNRKMVKWIPPARGICKLNFDGCSRGNPSESGARVCIRDHNGQVLGMLAQIFLVGTDNKAKAMELLLGLELVFQLSITNIHIKGDSSMMINSCRKNQKIGNLVIFWKMIDKFKLVSFSQTLREGNWVSDNLSNIGCDLKATEVIKNFILANFLSLFILIQQEEIF